MMKLFLKILAVKVIVFIRLPLMVDDDDMLDVGKEFQEIIKVPFTFIPTKPE